MLFLISFISLDVSDPLSSFWRVVKESVNITMSVFECGSLSNVLLISVIVFLMACFSASLLEQKDPQELIISFFSPLGKWMVTPRPAFVVALNAEPSVYTCVISFEYEAIVSSAEAFRFLGLLFLLDPSRSFVLIIGSFNGSDGGRLAGILSHGCAGSGR